MLIYLSRFDVLNHVHHNRQASKKLFYFHLTTFVKKHTFSHYISFHCIVKERHVITSSTRFLHKFTVTKINYYFLTCNKTPYMYRFLTLFYCLNLYCTFLSNAFTLLLHAKAPSHPFYQITPSVLQFGDQHLNSRPIISWNPYRI